MRSLNETSWDFFEGTHDHVYCLMSTNIAVSHFVNQVPRTENPKLIFEDLGSDVRNKKIFGCSKIVNSEFS